MFCEERRAIRPAFALYLLTHVSIYLKPLVFFHLGWGVGLGAAELGLIFLTCQVLLAVQLTPSGVGTLGTITVAWVVAPAVPIANGQTLVRIGNAHMQIDSHNQGPTTIPVEVMPYRGIGRLAA